MTPGTGPWAARTDGLLSLVKQPEPFRYRRVSCVAGVLRVSSKLGSSHRTLTTPVEAYAPPCKANILPFWRGIASRSAIQHFTSRLSCCRERQGCRAWALCLLRFVDSRLRGNDGGGTRRGVGAVGAKRRPNNEKLTG